MLLLMSILLPSIGFVWVRTPRVIDVAIYEYVVSKTLDMSG